MMSKLNNYTNLFFPVYKFNAHAAILNQGRKSTGTEYGDRLLPFEMYTTIIKNVPLLFSELCLILICCLCRSIDQTIDKRVYL